MLRRILVNWWPDVALLAAFAAVTAALASGWLLDIDLAVRDWCADHRPPAGYWTARLLNYLGNGGPLTLVAAGLAVLLGRRQRQFLRALVPVVAAFVLTTGVILSLKRWTSRAAPASRQPDAVELFNDLPVGEYADSYPSGHVVVAIVWYGVIVALLNALLRSAGRAELPRAARLALRVAPPVIVFGTTTYLGFHWLTDGIAAVFVGLLLDRLLSRLPGPHSGQRRHGITGRVMRPRRPPASRG